MRFKLAALLLLSPFYISNANAQDFQTCTSLRDDKARLACFDAASASDPLRDFDAQQRICGLQILRELPERLKVKSLKSFPLAPVEFAANAAKKDFDYVKLAKSMNNKYHFLDAKKLRAIEDANMSGGEFGAKTIFVEILTNSINYASHIIVEGTTSGAKDKYSIYCAFINDRIALDLAE